MKSGYPAESGSLADIWIDTPVWGWMVQLKGAFYRLWLFLVRGSMGHCVLFILKQKNEVLDFEPHIILMWAGISGNAKASVTNGLALGLSVVST